MKYLSHYCRNGLHDLCTFDNCDCPICLGEEEDA